MIKSSGGKYFKLTETIILFMLSLIVFFFSLMDTSIAELSSKIYYFSLASAIFILSINCFIEFMKPKHCLLIQGLLHVLILILIVLNLCYSPRETFHIIANSLVLIVCSMSFTFIIVKGAVERVIKKVDFQPVRPIIKP